MMDSGATKIVLGIVILTAFPFIVNYLYKKRKILKFLNDFLKLAEREKVKISQKELWNNRYAIGIDNNSKKIIYAIKQKENLEGTLIDLSEIEECRIVNINRTVKNQYGKNNVSDRLELVFKFRNSKIPEKNLEFYESAEFMPAAEDLSQIENWLNLVNSNLKSLKSNL